MKEKSAGFLTQAESERWGEREDGEAKRLGEIADYFHTTVENTPAPETVSWRE